MKLISLEALPAVSRYLERIGAETRSFKTAVVREKVGSYWQDVAVIRFLRDGKVVAPKGYEPNDTEIAEIANEMQNVEWPEVVPIHSLKDAPDEVREARPEDVFEFRGLDSKIIMVQLRRVIKGEKIYVPYTFWSDGEWRSMEPEGPLPLWGADQLNIHSTVFLHEGAKAARFVRELVEATTPQAKALRAEHPWADEMAAAAHLGWIGGARSPHRTDFSVLAESGVRRVYIVSDNDDAGVAAVPAIARQLRCPTFHVQFTNEWPSGFDLADEFPKDMFSKVDGRTTYVGPSFRACLHPATWATDVVTIPPPGGKGKGKEVILIRESFKTLWAYIEEADLFVCTELPEIRRPETILNKILAPFSHTARTSDLIVKSYSGRTTKICYRPDVLGRIVTDKTTSAINLHTPSTIKAEDGNPKPFLEFVNYLFPNKAEAHNVLKWCATIIACPHIRMHYGLLLVTENQGLGKTTLASHVLAPLVGVQNVSWPTEKEVTNSDFNGWAANKRLVIVSEIYSGHSWRAYNSLKSMITDSEITVNEKFQRPYTVENWGHIIASSNSLRALRLEQDDRRWFYPQMTETAWPLEKFRAFRTWLAGGGLSVIAGWANKFGEYVASGERAPMTERKQELIRGSRSEAQQEAVAIAESALSNAEAVFLAMKDVVFAVRSGVQGKVFESDYDLRKAMTETGMLVHGERVKIAGRLDYVIMNKVGAEALANMQEDERSAFIRKSIRKISELMEGGL